MSCVVGGCKSHSSRKESSQELITFHRFPKDVVLRNEWVNRIGRRNWTPKKHSHICSKHFTLDSFMSNETVKWRRLTEDAVPTLIIDETNEMDSIPMLVCKTEPSTSYQDNESLKPLTSRPATLYQSQETLEQITTSASSAINYKRRIECLEKELEKSKKISKRRLRKINTLTKRVSRLREKNKDLYSILMKKLKQENIETEHITVLDKINKNDIIKR